MHVVLHVFDWGLDRDKRIMKYVLGHAKKDTSDHYDGVRLDGSAADLQRSRHAFGVFPLTDAELERAEALFGV
jgi:hypothetical protein